MNTVLDEMIARQNFVADERIVLSVGVIPDDYSGTAARTKQRRTPKGGRVSENKVHGLRKNGKIFSIGREINKIPPLDFASR